MKTLYRKTKEYLVSGLRKTGSVRKWAAMGALCVVVLSIAGYAWKSGKSTRGTSKISLIPAIRTVHLQPADLVHRIESPGTVTFFEKAAVNSKVPGRVEKLFADQGDQVKKGARLAQMETFELKIKLRQAIASRNSALAQRNLARARYSIARRNITKQLKSMERMQADILNARASFLNAKQSLLNKKEVYQLGGASRMELKTAYTEYLSAMTRYYQSRKDYQTTIIGFRDADLKKAGVNIARSEKKRSGQLADINTEVEKNEVRAAEAAYRNALLAMDNIRLIMKESTVVSPLSGVIASRGIEAGEEIKPGEPLFTVVRTDVLLVSSNLAVKDIIKVRAGGKVEFRIDALEGRKFQGTIHRVAPVIDVKTRTAEVRVKVDNGEGLLRPGMFARCRFILREKKGALALPRSALTKIRKEEKRTIADVYEVRDGFTFRRTVTLGEIYGEDYLILAGLKPGVQIAVTEVQTLKDGGNVKVLNSKSGLGPEQKDENKKKESRRSSGKTR